MKLSIQERKILAGKAMNELSISDAVVAEYLRAGDGATVPFYNTEGQKTEIPEEIAAEVRRIEGEKEITIYAVLKTLLSRRIDVMETYTMLCISPYPEDVETSFSTIAPFTYRVYAYVLNRTVPGFSEFGMITVKYDGKSLRRIY